MLLIPKLIFDLYLNGTFFRFLEFFLLCYFSPNNRNGNGWNVFSGSADHNLAPIFEIIKKMILAILSVKAMPKFSTFNLFAMLSFQKNHSKPLACSVSRSSRKYQGKFLKTMHYSFDQLSF